MDSSSALEWNLCHRDVCGVPADDGGAYFDAQRSFWTRVCGGGRRFAWRGDVQQRSGGRVTDSHSSSDEEDGYVFAVLEVGDGPRQRLLVLVVLILAMISDIEKKEDWFGVVADWNELLALVGALEMQKNC